MVITIHVTTPFLRPFLFGFAHTCVLKLQLVIVASQFFLSLDMYGVLVCTVL